MKAGEIKTKQVDNDWFMCSLSSFLICFSVALSYYLSLLNGNLDLFIVIHYCNSLRIAKDL